MDRDAPVGFGGVAALGVVLILVRPRRRRAGVLPWLALVCVAGALGGLALGGARIAAINAGSLNADTGAYLELEGTVVSAPRTSGELTRFALETSDGRIAVEVRALPPISPTAGTPASGAASPAFGAIDEGRIVSISGSVRAPAPWERAQIERSGATRVVAADSVQVTEAARGGLRGALDDVRRRAEAALERGTQPLSAALLRGFVLGQDDRIPEPVREDFRRSGLAHVLAVSGQNVMLLAILATPLLALAGVPLRARLVAIATIIAVYVPVAGAGASIQRAGIMGVAGIVAALASRPAARWYALGLAAAVTLAIDPGSMGDIGWQLSFAAVAGLIVLAPPLIRIVAPEASGLRRALADGAAITLAASLATAPIAAHHFGTVSLTSLPANLVALPAIAPAMWLGMLAGALGQIPGAPVEPLTWLGGLCAGFIGWVARVFGPDWAQLDVPEPGPVAAAVWTAVLVGGARLGCLALERRAAMRAAPRPPVSRRALAIGAVVVALAGAGTIVLSRDSDPPGAEPRLIITVLDIGQGDAILVDPRGSAPLLVDTGPPDGNVGKALAEQGVGELFGVAITHDDLDHSGGLASALTEVDARHLLVGDRLPQDCEYLDCPPATRLAEGSRFRLGSTRIEVMWPPSNAPPASNPNETSLVLRVSSGDFDALLTADAESEAASYAAAPVEFLKVAHHGSADAGLESLLVRASPQLAAISVGADNTYGHPAPETLDSLSERGVPVLRTDQHGEVRIIVTDDGWSIE